MLHSFIAAAVLLLSGLYLYGKLEVWVAARRFRRLHGVVKAKHAREGDRFGILYFLHMLRSLRNHTVLESLKETFDKWGENFEVTMLFRTNLQTVDPENIKTVLATKFADFDLGRRYEAFFPTLGDGIFTLDYEGWSHSRALLRPQFSRHQVSDVAKLESHVSNLFKAMPHSATESCEIQELLFRMTMDSATEFLFGESVNSLVLSDDAASDNGPATTAQRVASDSGKRGFAAAFNNVQEYLSMRVLFQSLYWLVNTSEFRENNMIVHEFVDYYVEKALAKRHSNEKISLSENRYVFLDALAEETQDPRTLRDQLLNILLAGRDTTAGALTWAFYELARHPRVFEKLRAEILERFGDHPGAEGKLPMNFETLKNSLYLRYILNEILRLYPSVPQNFRIANKHTFLPRGGGQDGTEPIFIRKGEAVFYSVYCMHRRKDLYGDDAMEFRPERWAEGKTWHWEYLPFNGGPRICLGQQYALTEAGYTLARVAQEFDTIETTDPDEPNGVPLKKANLTMSSAKGVHVRCYKK
ncbi:cytochrome P450 [Myxozyma melibiosi]|uniref:Cytochrome P450 n=1 Tax=Myxozyma melibiosi TaxID=54550 RepID=A0ABR1F7H4_9ASCO